MTFKQFECPHCKTWNDFNISDTKPLVCIKCNRDAESLTTRLRR